MKRAFFYKHEDICWGFHNKAPNLYLKVGGDRDHYHEVDPFPCYSHDEKLVLQCIKECESKVNFEWEPTYHILPYEDESRTSGYAADNKIYKGGDEKYELAPYIVLHGKRICIHPAWTRYLVAHELSHVVDYTIQHKLYLAGKKETSFREDYAKFRGITDADHYGALNWHNKTAEVIANDIRIIVFDKEHEFWPHKVSHPLETNGLRDYIMHILKTNKMLP